jgi:hypothetical protein
MSTPELKQFGDLVEADFVQHPVWIGCHTADYDEPWYDETDEETFRPWIGSGSPGPSEGMLLVRATIELSDGTAFPGFVTPAFEEGTWALSNRRSSWADGASHSGEVWSACPCRSAKRSMPPWAGRTKPSSLCDSESHPA